MEPEIVADRYALGERLGEGRYGEVYLAHDRVLDQQVAIKLLRGLSDTTDLFREAAYLRSLESPYVLRVDNAGTYGDVGYLATKVAVGRSAEDQLPVYGIGPDRILGWARQLLIGLRACHEHGLAHCDIKPGNLFLDERDNAALGDFGAAQRMDERGRVRPAGDPLVRAPEMLKGGPGGVSTDIYSVGVTLYRLLTGQWPAEAPGDFALLRERVTSGRYDALSDLAPHVPPALVLSVRKAMALDPDARYQSAEEMSRALGRVDLRRRYARRHAHAGHERCWIDAPSVGPSREVCVVQEGPRFSVTTRRATGARTRILDLCLDDVPKSRLGIELRRVLRAG